MSTWNEEEDGMGFSGLVPSRAERQQEKELNNTYARGRKDEREAVLKYLREEMVHCQQMAKENGGNPRYDYYADAYGVIIGDIEEWQ